MHAISIGSSGEGRLWRRFGGGLLAQFLAARLVPRADSGIRFGGKGGGGDLSGEGLASIRVRQVPILDSVNDEGDMFFRGEQDLDRLPTNEAPKGQSGNGGRIKVPRRIVVAVRSLEGVAAAEDLPDVGNGLVWGIDKEFVIVAAHRLVEGSEFVGLESLVLRVGKVVNNVLGDGAQERVQDFCWCLVWLVKIAIVVELLLCLGMLGSRRRWRRRRCWGRFWPCVGGGNHGDVLTSVCTALAGPGQSATMGRGLDLLIAASSGNNKTADRGRVDPRRKREVEGLRTEHPPG